jgi:hypothetical protein
MRKLLVVSGILALLTSVGVFASGILETIEVARNSITLEVNGEVVQEDNFIYEGKTYVQMRSVAEMLGKEVTWNDETRTAEIKEKELTTEQIQEMYGVTPTEPVSEPVKEKNPVEITFSDYHMIEDKTYYTVMFSDDFTIGLNINPVIFEDFGYYKSYHLITIGEAPSPKIYAFHKHLEDKYFPIPQSIYTKDFKHLMNDTTFNSYFTNHKISQNRNEIEGMLVFDYSVYNQVHYDDGFHKATLKIR